MPCIKNIKIAEFFSQVWAIFYNPEGSLEKAFQLKGMPSSFVFDDKRAIRDLLAKDEMSLSAGAIDLALDDHIYFSKEGTSVGRGFAGGGCGCN